MCWNYSQKSEASGLTDPKKLYLMHNQRARPFAFTSYNPKDFCWVYAVTMSRCRWDFTDNDATCSWLSLLWVSFGTVRGTSQWESENTNALSLPLLQMPGLSFCEITKSACQSSSPWVRIFYWLQEFYLFMLLNLHQGKGPLSSQVKTKKEKS